MLFILHVTCSCIPMHTYSLFNIFWYIWTAWNFSDCLSLSPSFLFTFYERPSSWGEYQFTYCLGFAKGLRFLNMVMTFFLHPFSHYNSITEPRALFLLSLLEHLIIDFSFYFILSIIDVHRDSASRDKLIFPSAITKILRHFSIPFLVFDHFSYMCAIDATTVKHSEAQFRSR